jgi:hypothetical protein
MKIAAKTPGYKEKIAGRGLIHQTLKKNRLRLGLINQAPTREKISSGTFFLPFLYKY